MSKSANVAMDDECENERMKEVENDMITLISSMHLGSEEVPIEEYMQLQGRKLLMQGTSWFSSRIWHGIEESI